LLSAAAEHAAMQAPFAQPWSSGHVITTLPLPSTTERKSPLHPSVPPSIGPPSHPSKHPLLVLPPVPVLALVLFVVLLLVPVLVLPPPPCPALVWPPPPHASGNAKAATIAAARGIAGMETERAEAFTSPKYRDAARAGTLPYYCRSMSRASRT
jgi:hypothetical protein